MSSNGQEGFERALELVPDIIISDIMMPVMDGITFYRKLKSDMRISHIPVILLTARTPKPTECYRNRLYGRLFGTTLFQR
ncbi:response regulator [uncultured Bacteroides sp.]|uniref:response regulator n=1 Tax=uncultured Bacteroides sp. TaxID=162156 RepID=UPI0009344BF4